MATKARRVGILGEGGDLDCETLSGIEQTTVPMGQTRYSEMGDNKLSCTPKVTSGSMIRNWQFLGVTDVQST